MHFTQKHTPYNARCHTYSRDYSEEISETLEFSRSCSINHARSQHPVRAHVGGPARGYLLRASPALTASPQGETRRLHAEETFLLADMCRVTLSFLLQPDILSQTIKMSNNILICMPPGF